MFRKLSTTDDFTEWLNRHPLCAVYFSAPDCSVCEALKPKLHGLLQQRFPQLALGEVDCAACRELAAQQMVFTIPTLIVYFDGREGIRKVRSFSLGELAAELERPYGIFTAP
jgi:thioredoxin-like negative regulator of GroEL